jgi:hypothetical protein
MAIESVTRLKIVVTQREYSALVQASNRTLRTPDAEARLIIRRELERRGLLPLDDVTGNQAEKVQHAAD